MELSRYVNLLSTIDDATDAERFDEALELVLTNFDRVGDDALLRERIAVVLALCGRKKEAVEVWDHVARHWANMGQPARSLAAIKQMQALRPDTTVLLDHFSALYHIQSPYLEAAASPPVLSTPTAQLQLDVDTSGSALDERLDRGFELATDPRGLIDEPGNLPPLPLLSLLPTDALRRVLDFLEYESFAEPEPIIETGRLQDELIWTVTADFIIEDREPQFRLPSGSLLGLNNFGQSPSVAEHTIESTRGSELLRLSAEAIETLDEELGDFRNRLVTLRRHAITEGLLERHEMFASLDKDERLELMDRFRGARVSPGEVLIKQDRESPGIFLVLDGQVDVVRNEDGWEITIATLSTGDILGEVGVVSDKSTLAECVMTTAGHLLYVPREEFGDIADRYPAMAKYLVNLANKRIQEVETTLSAQDLAEVD